jgi:hypothetical protein
VSGRFAITGAIGTHERVDGILIPKLNADNDGPLRDTSGANQICEDGWRLGCAVHFAHNDKSKTGLRPQPFGPGNFRTPGLLPRVD